MTDWKDRHRERKEASGLSWNDYVNQRLVHVDDIPESELAEIREHLDAVQREYRDMKREVFELKTMLESEEFDP
jgi:hypothetical protein